MRNFTIYTPDKLHKFSLSADRVLAAEPTGLGNQFSISYKDSTTGKYPTNITENFEPITLPLYFNSDGSDGYINYKELMAFLGRCAGKAFPLEYDDGYTVKFCDVVLQAAPKSEINEEGVFCENFVFERQSYWYKEIQQVFSLTSIDNTAINFELGFPFGFAGKVFTNKFSISNDFFKAAPIVITISGDIAANISIYIKDEKTAQTVAEIQLNTNSRQGTTITIDAVNKKITVDDNGTITNGYGLTNKTKQSFLYLPNGDYIIGSNITQDDDGEIKIAVKSYLFD